MECDLIARCKSKALTSDDIGEQTEVLERIIESDRFDVSVVTCTECGQYFICCFRQYTTADFEDDYWTSWVPVDRDELKEIRNAEIPSKCMGEMVCQRSNICWHPEGHVFWAENGFPLALVIFLP